MCGRFISGAEEYSWQEYCELLRLPTTPDLPEAGDKNPTQSIAAIRHDGEQLEVVRLLWGLLPPWAKERKDARKLFNVRSETVHSKFRVFFERKRCVIPAGGFYEWKKPETGRKKIPYVIFERDRPILSFAGIWSRWTDEEGESLETCAILTTSASEKLKPLHHRMPVILPPEAALRWLADGTEKDALKTLFSPYESPMLVVEPVTPETGSEAQGSLF